VIIFVCPFIPEEHRRVFRGQGAIVKEIELLDDIIPDEAILTKRWIDVLSKLNLWKEVEWKRIAFLDSDAFPVRNLDDIFESVQEQKCNMDALQPEDRAVVDNGKGGENMCSYVYAGVAQFSIDNINAGMLVLKPNLDMHAKLIRAAKRTGDYDVKEMEQGVLKSKNAFAADGPFPVNRLPSIWNALPEYYIQYLADNGEARDGPVRVLHVKMWNRLWGSWNNLTALNDMWDLDWMKMCRFYDSADFVKARTTGIFETPWERYVKSQNQSV
jgi:alpha-N-acetylglucosamine transferase